MHISTNLIVTILAVFVFNVPFGYWRYNVRKFSVQWVLAVHLPVPFIILARIFMNIGFHWSTYVFLVAAFFTGQLAGGKLLKFRKKQGPVSSCLVMDLLHHHS